MSVTGESFFCTERASGLQNYDPGMYDDLYEWSYLWINWLQHFEMFETLRIVYSKKTSP